MLKILDSPRHSGIESYLQKLQSIPVLEHGEAEAVFRSAATGDQGARERILLAHLSLTVRIAYKYVGYGLPLADLISEGNLGLLRAVELFDPKFGVAFTTYAGVWIKQRIHRAITSQANAVRIPIWRSQRLRKLDRLHEELSAELGRDAEITDLANCIGISQAELSDIAADRVKVSSIEAENGSGETVFGMAETGTPRPDEHLLREELREEIISALHGLDDTELQILSLKFGLVDDHSESYRQMAPRFGRSREWIRVTGERALAKVTASLKIAGYLPRTLIQIRRNISRRRLEALAGKKSESTSNLSVFKFTLMHWMEPIVPFL